MNALLQEMLHEITGEPLVFAAELVQFLLLIVFIRYLLRRSVGSDLKKRRDGIAAEVERANQADAAFAEARQQAAALVADARKDARRILETAGTAAQEERRRGLDKGEQEAGMILIKAGQSIETEKARVASEASEQLVSLITQVTRRYIEEALTESERRAMTEKLILVSLDEMEGTASHP